MQAQVLNLLEDLKAKYGLTLIFIAHDLAVVKNISDRVAVMYLGKICEVAPSDDLYRAPAHHYTAVLLELDPGARSQDRRHEDGDRGRAALASAAAAGMPVPPPLPRRNRQCAAPKSRSCARSPPVSSWPAITPFTATTSMATTCRSRSVSSGRESLN